MSFTLLSEKIKLMKNISNQLKEKFWIRNNQKIISDDKSVKY